MADEGRGQTCGAPDPDGGAPCMNTPDHQPYCHFNGGRDWHDDVPYDPSAAARVGA